MSIFASRTQKTIELPFDPPHTVTIQKLAGRFLHKAQQEDQFASADALRRMGGPKFQKELEGLGDPAERADLVKKHQADPLNAYDKSVLLYGGIVAWTYPESLKRELVQETTDDGRQVTVTRVPAIDDLDAEAEEFLAREILRLTKPSLFQDADAAEADRKNAVSGSTSD